MAETKSISVIKEETIDAVTAKIHSYQKGNSLHLPAGYSAENALKSAWLMLQNTKDRNDVPVLQSCTKESIVNSLLEMVVQGLNPAKKQGYFIAYGKQLVFQRSYFGTMAVAKQVNDDIQEIIAEVVYEGDVFKYRLNRGKKEIAEHEQSLDNINGKKIKAAYCMIIDSDGQVIATEIMTYDQIKQAWAQSQMKPIDEKGNVKTGTTHDKFTSEMCKKTVINRTCKSVINSSSDSHLFKQIYNRTEEVIVEDKVSGEIAANANTETIDVEGEPVVETVEKTEVIDIEPETKLAPTGTDGPDY